MKLFTLEATLGLDAAAFATGVAAAQTTMTGLQKDITSSTATIDAEIAALDKELADLEAEIADMELDLSLDDIEGEIDSLTEDIKKQGFKESFLDGFYGGLTESAGEILGDLVEKGFEFLGDSVEVAAQSGTVAADEYNRAMARMAAGTENLQTAIGNKLMPVLTSTYNIIADIIGVDDWQIRNSMLDQLASYRFENLKQAEESLENIFGFGEMFKPEEEVAFDFDEMLAGFESQQEYWDNYKNLIADLSQRGLNPALLAQFSSGSESDYNYLQWFSDLTDSQIDQLMTGYQAANDARMGMASMLSALQLETDAQYQALMDEYDQFRDDLDAGGGMRFHDPAAAVYAESMSEFESTTINPRAGSVSVTDDMSAQIGALAAAVAALNSSVESKGGDVNITFTATIDGQEVGSYVAPIVEREIARDIGTKAR